MQSEQNRFPAKELIRTRKEKGPTYRTTCVWNEAEAVGGPATSSGVREKVWGVVFMGGDK